MIYLAIMALTVFDAWATWLGVTRYGIEEGNALARLMFEWSIPGTCVLAVLLTGSMLLVIRHYADQYRWIGWAVAVVLVAKIAVAGLHTVWLVMI